MDHYFNDADLTKGDCPFGFRVAGIDEIPDCEMCALKMCPINTAEGLQECTPSNTECPIKTEKQISFNYIERKQNGETQVHKKTEG